MGKQQIVRTAKRSVLGLISIGVVFVLTDPSFAGCEARCKNAKAAQICGSAMNQKGLKGPERKTEYEKCKMDPYGYK
jgi:hypothetical protein